MPRIICRSTDVSGHIKEELKSLRKRLAEPGTKKSLADERIEKEALMSSIEQLIGDKTRILKFLKLIDRMLIESMFVHAFEYIYKLCVPLRNAVKRTKIGSFKNSNQFRA